MSARPQPPLDVLASQLEAAIEAYEQEVDRLLAAWPDRERYPIVSERVDEVRRYAAAVPYVSVQFVGFLIAHTELMHALWKTVRDSGEANARQLEAAREWHRASAAALRLKCQLPPR